MDSVSHVLNQCEINLRQLLHDFHEENSLELIELPSFHT